MSYLSILSLITQFMRSTILLLKWYNIRCHGGPDLCQKSILVGSK